MANVILPKASKESCFLHLRTLSFTFLKTINSHLCGKYPDLGYAMIGKDTYAISGCEKGL